MKCQKVPKNPCKICLQKVTKKNGLQCKGVCRTWAHFKCLNYTPGKIQDIKAGVIKVICPCPNCETNEPKEIVTNPRFSCSSLECPANLPPPCESMEYASKANPIPYRMYGSDTSCKSSQSPNFKSSPSPKYKRSPADYSQNTRQGSSTNQSVKIADQCSCSRFIVANQSRQGVEESTQAMPKDQRAKIADECPCSRLIAANQSHSYSDVSKSKQRKMRPSSSDFKVPCTGSEENQKMLYSNIQSLCNTVNKLSKQLRDLMCKLEKCNK